MFYPGNEHIFDERVFLSELDFDHVISLFEPGYCKRIINSEPLLYDVNFHLHSTQLPTIHTPPITVFSSTLVTPSLCLRNSQNMLL